MSARLLLRKIIFLFLLMTSFCSCEKQEMYNLSGYYTGELKGQQAEPSQKGIVLQTVYGPQQFMLAQKRPVIIKEDVIIENYLQYREQFVIHVQNGSADRNYMVSDAVIRIDGTAILDINESNKNQSYFEIIADLPEVSVIEVELIGKPICYLTISISGVIKPYEEVSMVAIKNAEEIFAQIQPVYAFLLDNGQGNPPVLPEGLSAKYLTSEDSLTRFVSLTFTDYLSSTQYLINGDMDLKSVMTGHPSQPPYTMHNNFGFDGRLKATGLIYSELDYYHYQFHIILNSLISWTNYPDSETKTVLTQYDFESMYIFINNISISPGIILDIMGK